MYLAAGFILVGLASLGIFLPLLPTTPLLILAAACFAHSSERWHRWLMQHPVFGPLLHQWHEHRCIPGKAKVIAVCSILLFGGYAVGYAVQNPAVRIGGGLLLLAGLIYVLRIPTCKSASSSSETDAPADCGEEIP